MFLLQNKKLILSSLFLILNMSGAHAAKKSTTPQEPIDIKAQYLMLDEKKGISKYKGNVLFTQGTLIIKADTITLYYDGEKLTKAFVTGSPADVKHHPENEEKVHSQAKTIEYLITKEKLILKGNAFVDQGERHFSGEKIEYDTQRKTVIASGKKNSSTKTSENNSSNNRVHVIIGPTTETE